MPSATVAPDPSPATIETSTTRCWDQLPPILLPLTTTFTPPAYCSMSWDFSVSDGIASLWQDLGSGWHDCYPGSNNPSCAAEGIGALLTSNDTILAYYPTFSPGICPSGYVTIFESIDLVESETLAACCTRNFEGDTSLYLCMSTAADYKTITLVHNGTMNDGPSTNPNSALSSKSAITITTAWKMAWFFAPMVWVQFKEGELPTSSTSQSTSTHVPKSSNPTASSSRPTITHVTQTSPAATAGGTQEDNGLSAGAKAGIGIGAALAALFIVGCTIVWLSRQRRKNGQSPEVEWHKPEMDGTACSDGNMAELDAGNGGVQPVELPAVEKPQEAEVA